MNKKGYGAPMNAMAPGTPLWNLMFEDDRRYSGASGPVVTLALIVLLVLAVALAIMVIPLVKADTGTYTIEKQYTNLTITAGSPDVLIDYYIKMRVDGGNIPWLTIGLPNSNFAIENYGLNAQSAQAQNEYGWTGIRIDLDKTYYSGDELEVSLQATQRGFVNKYGDQASIQFSPNYWDNAITEDLKINVIVLGNISNVTTSSEPEKFENNTILWSWQNVGRGQKETIGVLMPLSAFPTLSSSSGDNSGSPGIPVNSGTPSGDSGGNWWFWIVGIVAVLFGFKMFSGLFDSYDSPSVSSGGDEEVTRHINMDCPNDKARLDKRTIKDVTIDFCDVCGGAFFNKGEIEKLIKAKVNEEDLNTNKIKQFSSDRKPISKCPSCEGDMTRKDRTTDEGKKATIYVCEDCEGIWLNKGNYQIIKDKRLMQEEENEKRRKDGKDHHASSWWLFYPYFMSTGHSSQAAFASYGGGSSGGGGSSFSASSCVASSCVSCACVSACACACACAGGGAAGCAPKNKMKQIDLNKFYPKRK